MTAQTLMNPNPVTLRRTDTVAAAAEHIIKEHWNVIEKLTTENN